MRIQVKYHDENMPKLKHDGNFDWIDLVAVPDLDKGESDYIFLRAGEFRLISLGVSIKLPVGYEAHLAPRSSAFKRYGFIQTNGVGVVDETYCGDGDLWMLPIYSIWDCKIPAYDRIAQFRIMAKMPRLEVEEVATLKFKDRGGFGSTGRN
jgi:dUTP pyrophosphatase